MNPRNQQQTGDGAPQYRILNFKQFAIAYGKTAEEFNKMCLSHIKAGMTPDEYMMHPAEDCVHFIQFFSEFSGGTVMPKLSLMSSTEEIKLIHESDIHIFNHKVKECLDNGYVIALSESDHLTKPSTRLIGKEYWFTIKMIKCKVSIIEPAQAQPKSKYN